MPPNNPFDPTGAADTVVGAATAAIACEEVVVVDVVAFVAVVAVEAPLGCHWLEGTNARGIGKAYSGIVWGAGNDNGRGRESGRGRGRGRETGLEGRDEG